MKGFTVVLLVSFLLTLATTTSAYGVTETCQIVPNNTYIADPTSCTGWALCINSVPHYGQCGSGLRYSYTRAICDWADDVTCTAANVTTMCAGLNAVYKANPSDCQSYCYCSNGVSDCILCPSGQVYDPDTISCVYSSTYACAVNSPCALVPNGVFVQDASSCSGYYQCMNGVSTAGTCPSGYLYNSVDGTCDYPANVVCPNGSQSGNGDAISHPVANATTCANFTSGQNFVSDGATCQGYFYCINATTLQPAWGQCPTGTHFSQSEQECVNIYDVACPYNRCEGVSSTFVTAINTDCKEYDICSNGATVMNSEADCPTAFPYFDEVEQACVATEPSYAVCS